MISKFQVTKTMSLTVREYNNFFVVDNRYAILHKHLHQLGIDFKSLSYDEIQKLEIPRYSYIPDVQNLKFKKDWVKQYWEELPLPTDRSWELADSNIEKHLIWFCKNSHTLWNVEMKRLSNPIFLNYIDARLHDGNYDLEKVKDLFQKSDKLKMYEVEIDEIPYYNRDKNQNNSIYAFVLFNQKTFEEIIANSSAVDLDRYENMKKLGFVHHSPWSMLDQIKEALNLESARK